jgi:hypothetical protein
VITSPTGHAPSTFGADDWTPAGIARPALGLTRHAVERFQERVRPGLDLEAAQQGLARLVGLGEISDRAPAWLACRMHKRSALYLVVGDVVLPLARGNGGRLIALTCLVRGGLSQAARHRRNQRRRDATARNKPMRARPTASRSGLIAESAAATRIEVA